MDPLTAISLVSNINAFIDFGFELVSAAKDIHGSATGTTEATRHIEFLNTRMGAVAADLTTAKSQPGGLSADKKRLVELADQCLGLSGEFEKLLGKLKAKDPTSKRQVIGAIIRNIGKKDEKLGLEARLDQCRQQLHLQLSHTTRLDCLSRLNEIPQTGKCHESEMRSLSQQLSALELAVADLEPYSKFQEDVRTILELSDQALTRVIQSNILEALRFQEMDIRFDQIQEAHAGTFKWLLEDTIPSSTTMPTTDTTDTADPWVVISDTIAHHLEEEEPLRDRIHKDFTNWLLTGHGMFHISGKPGAGKSTMMKYLAESDKVKEHLLTWAHDKELVFASFFFWRHGTDFQKSLYGLLRSLLHSVLSLQPELTRTAFPTQWDAACNTPGSKVYFRQSDIQKAFTSFMNNPGVYLGHKFAFFIDGLDEFQGREDTLIKTLFDWAHSGLDNIKICVSSRELPIFQQRLYACPKFRLHEVTHHDICLFVFNMLQNNEDVQSASFPKDAIDLGALLVDKAEGVFLWVSTALRLVERGLLLEESIEDLRSSIHVLPTEVEELFQVIFDSLKKEPDLSKRRKAMRILSLVVGVEVPEYHGHGFNEGLCLMHLSFMDDYDHNMDFVNRIKGFQNATDITARLSRCKKQLDSGCRGFLSTVVSPGLSGHLFRRDRVTLTHRSLVEFFKRLDVQLCIGENSKGFDALHFHCQSLIAELKLRLPIEGLGAQYQTLRASCSNIPQATEEYFQDDMGTDLRHLTYLHDSNWDSDTYTLTSTLHWLLQIARSKAIGDNSGLPFFTFYPCSWQRTLTTEGDPYYVMPVLVFAVHPTAFIILHALECGYHEFWLADVIGTGTLLRELILVEIGMALMRSFYGQYNARNTVHKHRDSPELSQRLLQTLATCFKNETWANSAFPARLSPVVLGPHSVWQDLLWHSILTSRPQVSPAPVWLLFLLNGAHNTFKLKFEQSCNFSEADGLGKLISVTGYWCLDEHQVHSSIFIAEVHGGILEIAKRQNWSVSLKDITDFWFPRYAKRFQNVYEFYEDIEDSVGIPLEDLENLRQDLGFGLEPWVPQEWEIPGPFFHSWTGESRIL